MNCILVAFWAVATTWSLDFLLCIEPCNQDSQCAVEYPNVPRLYFSHNIFFSRLLLSSRIGRPRLSSWEKCKWLIPLSAELVELKDTYNFNNIGMRSSTHCNGNSKVDGCTG
jgi:hypothetical protein